MPTLDNLHGQLTSCSSETVRGGSQKVKAGSRGQGKLPFSWRLADEERALLLGTLLGDGTLVRYYHRGDRFHKVEISHKIEHTEYVEHKRQLFRSFLVPQKYLSKGKWWLVRSYSHPVFTELYKLVYRRPRHCLGTKQLTETTVKWLSPCALALWYMDDGTLSGKEARLTTVFDPDVYNLFQAFLKEKFGIKRQPFTYPYNKSFTQFRFCVKESQKFFDLIRPYVISIMTYKLYDSKTQSEPTGDSRNRVEITDRLAV